MLQLDINSYKFIKNPLELLEQQEHMLADLPTGLEISNKRNQAQAHRRGPIKADHKPVQQMSATDNPPNSAAPLWPRFP